MSILSKINIKSPLIPLCLLILIDHMGFGILYPILVPIFMDPTGGILGLGATEAAKSFWYSITLSVFPVCVFFCAAMVGDFSDQFGRKRVLVVCLLIATVAYALSAIAVDTASLGLLLLSRVFAGFSAGSMPIAQAAAIDLSDEKSKAANLGLVILMASTGFLLGPLVSAFFTNTSIVSWFSYSTPLYVASVLALLNLFMLLGCFQETFLPKKRAKIDIGRLLGLLVIPFKTDKIRFLASIFLLMQLGWSFYFQFISIFLLKKHAFTGQEIGYFMALMGVGFVTGSCWVLRIITRYFSDPQVGLLSLSVATFGSFLTICDIHPVFTWFTAFLLGMSMSVAYSILVKLFSSIVSEDKQGWIMGVSEAIASMAWATTPLVAGYLESVELSIPLSLGTSLLLFSAILLRFWKPSDQKYGLEEDFA